MALVWLAAVPARAGDAAPRDLGELTLEQLANIEITSVSKHPEALSGAPAAVYVITADDLRRSGATSLADALRLAPNLQVAQLSASSYAITARGFNHQTGTANKLQVLIDGRSVYTPLYSGVFWDVQDVMLEDVERIEVVSGPGGTLWGANAVNGVINVITREAAETPGGYLRGYGGSEDNGIDARFGGRIGDTLAWRVYGTYADHGATQTVNGPKARDGWDSGRGGFRVDWSAGADQATLQGDAYDGDNDHVPNSPVDGATDGGNLLARWSHRTGAGGVLEAQTYFNRDRRLVSSGIRDSLDTYDASLQYSLPTLGRHQLVTGVGYRANQDHFAGALRTSFLDPASRTTTLADLFAQDQVRVRDDLVLTVGLKLERNSYTGLEYLPDARLAWTPADGLLFWGAVSRGVRTPSRFDRDLINPGLLAGGPQFESEYLTAYELGYRGQPTPAISISVSTFYQVYTDLRTVEATGPRVFPLTVRNGMEGETYGVEAWGTWQVTPAWRLNAGLDTLRKDLRLKAGSRDLFGVQFAGDDPDFQAQLGSHLDLSDRLELDLDLRHVARLPSPQVPAYSELNARLGWRISDQVEVSLSGENLLNDHHAEFINPGVTRLSIPRTARADLRLRF